MKFENKKEFYSLRKFKGVGLASALVGLMFLGSTVKADETVVSENKESTSLVTTTTDNSLEGTVSNVDNNSTTEINNTETINKRNKREVSDESSNTTRVDVGEGHILNVAKEGRTSVSKIDYTVDKNPMKEPLGNIYNNQIESIERLTNENAEIQRYRIKLKDGETIPNGGRIVLSGIGFGHIKSSDLVLNNETVGFLHYDYNEDTQTTKEFNKTLNNINSIDDYTKKLDNLNRFDIPQRYLSLSFNKNFEKYNKDRVIEFSVSEANFLILDKLYHEGGEIVNTEILDTKGISHKLSKPYKMFLINPFDDKKIIDTNSINVTVLDTRISKEEVSNLPAFRIIPKDIDRNSKPYYIDSAKITNMSDVIIYNGDNTTKEPVIKSGTIFKVDLNEDSLFTFKKAYQIGKIINARVDDLVKDNYKNNRFIDSNLNKKKEKNNSSKNKTYYVKFKLVESDEKTMKWELLEDINLVNQTLTIDTAPLFNYQLKSDWISRYGIENLKTFLQGNKQSGINNNNRDKFASSLSLISPENNIIISDSGRGVFNKNTNLVYGDSTRGTVKLRYKTTTGIVLGEETIASDQPWYTPVNITPKTFEGYQFKTSSEGLSTLAGSGERTIELIYTKPETSTEKEPVKTVYVIDKTKPGTYRNEVKGKEKVSTYRTDYIYDENTRTAYPQKTLVSVEEGKDTVVTLGNQPTSEVTEQDFPIRYEADNNLKAKETNIVTKGVKGTTTITTTYEVDLTTGKVTPTVHEPVVKNPTEQVVKVGTKSKVEEKEVPFKVEYKEDKTISSIDLDTMWKLRVKGKNGKLITTTTYSLNTQTGEVTENTTTSTEKPVNEFRVIGIKPEVTTEVISVTTKYEEDKTKEAGTTEIVNPGKEGKIVTTTNFRVEYSGDNNEFYSTIAEEPIVDKTEMIQKVVKVGTKPKVTTEVIPITTKEEKDDSKVVGTSETINPGKEGKIVTTTPYILNEKDGTVKEGTPTVEKTEMIQKLVKVGTHPASEVPNEAPSYELPEFNGGVNPNEAPSVEIPEFNGGVNPNEAPSVDVPEFEGGVNPNEAPSVDVPEFNGGVNPNEAPSVDIPEFNGDLTKEDDKSKDTKNKKSLPNTGMASGSIMTLLGGLSFAGGLGLSRKKKED